MDKARELAREDKLVEDFLILLLHQRRAWLKLFIFNPGKNLK